MFETLCDGEGNVICRVNRETGELEIKGRSHGQARKWIVNAKTFAVRQITPEPMKNQLARGPTGQT